MNVAARASNLLATACNLLLIGLLLIWLGWLLPPPEALVVPFIVVLVVPLLAPLRGLLHGRRYTHAWTSLLAMLYFVHGIAAAGTPGLNRVLGTVEIVLSLGLFTGCVLHMKATRQAPSP
ncbi:MAG: DUF2069 domain-containing protein [Aquisalimonadaceae bacterium]